MLLGFRQTFPISCVETLPSIVNISSISQWQRSNRLTQGKHNFSDSKLAFMAYNTIHVYLKRTVCDSLIQLF